MLNPRWIMPECTSVALSGVRKAGSAGHGTGRPLRGAGMKPSESAALSPAPTATAQSHASTVSAVIAMVAVRGIRFTPLPPFVPSEVEGSDELDLLDFVIAVARPGRDFTLLALLAADQRAPERRIVADPSLVGVGFGLPDELVAHLLLVFVEQRHRRPENDLVARQGRRVDDHRPPELVLEVGDGRLDLALPLLGGVVFGILRQIA